MSLNYFFDENKRYPLKSAEIGCYNTGVFVLSEDYSTILGIPWLTIIKDTYSDYVLGIHLSLEAPNLQTMALTFRNMIERKEWVKKYPKIKYEWESFGLPETIICPKKYDIFPICNAMNISLDQSVSKRMNTWGKTLKDDLFSRLKGNIHLTKNDKRFKPEKSAIHTIGSLKQTTIVYMLGVHHQSWQIGTYGVPKEKFLEGIKRHPLKEPSDPLWKEKLERWCDS
ncbi:hypothetical protein [Paenibacillus amylolyticus]|uniref:hypothetical protein n=1 Tax=Paenibacillus amylolyticus TaxID=1451 RepID=UPI0033970422